MPFLLVQPLGHDGPVMLDRPGLAHRLAARDEVEHVGRIVFTDLEHPAIDEDPALVVGEEPDRVEAGRDLPEGLALAGLLVDEAPCRHPRQRPFDPGLRGVHVLDDERLVAPEIPLDLLVRRRGVEEAPVEVPGELREALLEPRFIVRPDLGEALWPGRIVTSEAGGRGPVAGRPDEAARILDVGQRMDRAVLAAHRREAFADRVRRVALAAEGVLPCDRHLGERLRIGHPQEPEAAVSDDVKRLVDRPELDPHRARGARHGARGEAAAVHEQLSPELRHALVEDGVAPELRAGEPPEALLIEQVPRRLEREEDEERHDEVRLAVVLEHLGEQPQPVRLDGLHEVRCRLPRSSAGRRG